MRPLDHHHGQAEPTGSGEFGSRAFAAGIFTYNALNPLGFQQGQVARQGKRASIDHGGIISKRRRAGRRINQAKHVMVLGLGGKGSQVHAANGEQYTLGRASQGANRLIDRSHALPLVAVNSLPSGPGKGNGLNPALRSSGDNISAHLRGKRVGGIDNMGNALLGQKSHKPTHAAKAANASG